MYFITHAIYMYIFIYIIDNYSKLFDNYDFTLTLRFFAAYTVSILHETKIILWFHRKTQKGH